MNLDHISCHIWQWLHVLQSDASHVYIQHGHYLPIKDGGYKKIEILFYILIIYNLLTLSFFHLHVPNEQPA